MYLQVSFGRPHAPDPRDLDDTIEDNPSEAEEVSYLFLVILHLFFICILM